MNMNTRQIQNSFVAVLLLMALILAIAFAFVRPVYANPSQFTNTTQTATASSSVVYINPGAATTTLVADTYQVSTGNNYVNNTTELLVAFTASSTASQLNMNLEYATGYANGNAADCVNNPNSCDWFQDTGSNIAAGYATTTLPTNLAVVPQYQWKFASSTVGQQTPSASNNRDTRAIAINAPTRYVRAVFTCSPTANVACAVWAQFVPSKEAR